MMMFLLFLLPPLVLLPSLGQFIYLPNNSFSDLAISHYPNAVFLLNAIKSGQGIPWWSTSILSGYPFAADPLSGLWYPPGWLALLFPLPLGFNLMVILHMIFSGVGTYFWLRSKGVKPWAAVVGGLVFESLLKLMRHFAAGHLTLCYAAAWTPWLLLAEDVWQRKGGWRRLWCSPGVVLGIIILADVRWAAYAGLLWGAYSMRGRIGAGLRSKGVLPMFSRVLRGMLFQVMQAVFISTPLILPLLEYTRLASRSSLTPAEAFTLSIPPARLFGLIFPLEGSAEWTLYPGALAVAMCGVILFSSTLRKMTRFWLGVVLVTILFSLGSAVPFLPELARLPGFNLLRVPPRALIIMGFAMSVLCAYGIHGLLEPDPGRQFLGYFKPVPFLVGLSGFSVLMAGCISLLTGSMPFSFVWGVVALLIVALLIGLRLSQRIRTVPWLVSILVVSILDPGVVNALSVQSRPVSEVLSEGKALAEYLSIQQGVFRIYSPSYSLPQQTAAEHHLELADGVDPLQLAGYISYMEGATGVPVKGYSVTMPPFENGSPRVDNQIYSPDARRLGLLNVRYIAAEYDLTSPGLQFVEKFGKTRLYLNLFFRPRAWIQPETVPIGDEIKEVTITVRRLDRIEIVAQGEGRLVLSELVYPGWQAWVDGQPTAIQPAEGILRSVSLPAGNHRIVFLYQPLPVFIGIFLAALTWIGMIGAAVWRRSRSPG